jgi:hypothetical protein
MKTPSLQNATRKKRQCSGLDELPRGTRAGNEKKLRAVERPELP